jgi:tetratricopeptide (TPR) repeat protein
MRPLLLRVALVACIAAAPALAAPEPDATSVPTAAQIAQLAKQRDKRPRDFERRDELGIAYYRYARAAFDRGEFPEYEKYLGLAMDEWTESLRLRPENPTPHTFMGIVSAYQGRIDDALDSFQNARRLEPRAGVFYSNIAETMIYANRDAREVEGWLTRAQRIGVNPAILELNYCLLRWRDGKPEEAARYFTRALRMDPDVVRTWNEAPVSRPIQSFVDLTEYCCGSPACGPYLERACSAASLEVTRRELPEEVARRELLIEMERRRELERIYEQRKDLQIEVQRAEPEMPPTAGSQPAAKTPPTPVAPQGSQP